jgi:hypothetical protein
MNYLVDSLAYFGLAKSQRDLQPPQRGSASTESDISTTALQTPDSNTMPKTTPTSNRRTHKYNLRSRQITTKNDTKKKPEDTNTMHVPSSLPPDPVIEIIHAFIQAERKRSFSFLASHSHSYMNQEDLLIVSPADGNDIAFWISRVKLSYTAEHETFWYTFSEALTVNCMIRTVAISTSVLEANSIDDLEIFDPQAIKEEHQITPAATWIRRTYDWSENLDWEMKFTEMQYKEQRMWWDANGMHFRLMDLPTEMREAVYLQIIGPVVVPDVYTTSPRSNKVVLGHGLSHEQTTRDGSRRDPDVDAPNMRIMQVSKQVQSEAMSVAHRISTKRFCAFGARSNSTSLNVMPKSTISHILHHMSDSPLHLDSLRNVQLEMSAIHYFLSVGIQPKHGYPWASIKYPDDDSAAEGASITSVTVPSTAAAGSIFNNNAHPGPLPAALINRVLAQNSPDHLRLRTLSQLPALQTLDFRFISPKNPDAACPWSHAMGGTGNADHSCQKLWIDWFFVFAWPVLHALKDKGVKFSLSGCVKVSTRAKWQFLLNDQRVDRTEEMSARKQEIMKEKTGNGPIGCECSTLCPVGGRELFQCDEWELRRIEGIREEKDKVYWDFED